MTSLRVAVLGTGSLGGPIAAMLRDGEVSGCVLARSLGREDLDVRWDEMDVLVEAAGVDGARRWVPDAVDAGVDVLLCSCGALADDDFLAECTSSKAVVAVPTGAVGGIDLIVAAARSGAAVEVRLTTTKRSSALNSDKVGEIFRGSARSAARTFPRTANVAVTLGLALGDLDGVDVVVRADPDASSTHHLIEVASGIGDYRFELTNTTLPDSGGRTSTLTLWSVVSALEALSEGRRIALPVTRARGAGCSPNAVVE